MGKDSHKKRSQSEAPSRSRSHQSGSSSQQPSSPSSSRRAYRPSRLSQVTNAGDISDVDAQAEALNNLSFSQSSGQRVPLTFDTLAAWVRQGGQVESLDDSTLETLLSQYLGPKGERPYRPKYRVPREVPPPAPILEEDEDEGGVSLTEPSTSSSSQHKDKGKGKAR